MNNQDLASYLFHQGTNTQAQEYLGAHRDGDDIVFRVWAPNADRVCVTGDFNGWTDADPMTRVTDGGIFEGRVSADRVLAAPLYKYLIKNGDRLFYKADPYSRLMQKPPETAGIYYESHFEWTDGGWLSERRRVHDEGFYGKPMNIYEVHLGSFMRHEDGSYLSYTEAAEKLSSYVKQMGYTHIELMPIAEHPFDGSWGYQVCGFYAPTARFGTPDEFRGFINTMHNAGIGVILDWVPAHFPKDAHGLYEFDGQPLYEYQGKDRMENKGWGTRCFDLGRNEVECFLISNARYWATEFHADGLRVDAVASMLYLDYDREPGEWIPNVNGDNKNLEAIAFFRKLNSTMKTDCPDVLMIAEESTAFPNITRFDDGGLGFDLKWNMGWMNDNLSYAELDPYFRSFNHGKLTFSMMYAFSERYVLPISHDEVVHGKKSLLDKMPGEYDNKFAGLRAFFTFMMTHPGKKLTFMSSEIGQFAEWNYEKSVEWFLLDYERHRQLQSYVATLNNLYLSRKELWECDDSWAGFEWHLADSQSDSVIAFSRKAKDGRELLIVISFTPVERRGYCLAVPEGRYIPLLCSDEPAYGGRGILPTAEVTTVLHADGVTRMTFDLAPHGAVIFERNITNTGSVVKKPAAPKKRQTKKNLPANKGIN